MTGQRDIGLERQDGHDVGRDPRTMSAGDLERLGHARVSPLRALRLKCLDCCNGSAREVRLCTAVDCPSWPFRMGKNPWRAPLDQDERAARLVRLASKDASAPTIAQKAGDQTDAPGVDGGEVPGEALAEFSPTDKRNDTGDVQ